jgi:glycosyltransferase involved in cell wall biosynthesis
VRILVVAADYPWPETGGSRIRLANTLAALTECGEVDLLSIIPSTRDDADYAPPPQSVQLSRVVSCKVDASPVAPLDILSALLHRRNPLLLPIKARSIVRDAINKEFSSTNFDLVWFFTVRAWVWAGEPNLAPTVVDIDDLDDQKILGRLVVSSSADNLLPLVRHKLASKFWRFEVRRWQRLHRRIDETAVPVVCSDIDAARSGLRNVRVIPNGYKVPNRHVRKAEVGSTPTVMFQGTLRYPPNADAARFLIDEIAPHLASLVPGVQVRLVGVIPQTFAVAADPSLVTLVGPVVDIAEELVQADVIVVPLRFGSGTRIKILEAFAHRIPVVSTSLGAEGLDVEDGVHLLIGDDAVSIARACATLLSDVALAETIAANAYALFLERYESSKVQKRIRELVCEVARTSEYEASPIDTGSRTGSRHIRNSCI